MYFSRVISLCILLAIMFMSNAHADQIGAWNLEVSPNPRATVKVAIPEDHIATIEISCAVDGGTKWRINSDGSGNLSDLYIIYKNMDGGADVGFVHGGDGDVDQSMSTEIEINMSILREEFSGEEFSPFIKTGGWPPVEAQIDLSGYSDAFKRVKSLCGDSITKAKREGVPSAIETAAFLMYGPDYNDLCKPFGKSCRATMDDDYYVVFSKEVDFSIKLSQDNCTVQMYNSNWNDLINFNIDHADRVVMDDIVGERSEPSAVFKYYFKGAGVLENSSGEEDKFYTYVQYIIRDRNPSKVTSEFFQIGNRIGKALAFYHKTYCAQRPF